MENIKEIYEELKELMLAEYFLFASRVVGVVKNYLKDKEIEKDKTQDGSPIVTKGFKERLTEKVIKQGASSNIIESLNKRV